ncbi:MAG: phospho-N-acetylmuramoyl-pentapeptide-transferase [Saprospiraceae bacterium]|nr:phospho-N-acetylmuramoyl-pentapeptide-transferase [Saprospiraceae bacterium]
MIYNLAEWLEITYDIPLMGLFKYITFRAGLAIVLSLIVSMLFGGRIIEKLRALQVGETVRDLGLAGQKKKEGTPTMGGVMIILSILVPCLLLADLSNVYVILMILATVWMGAIGFVDDYIKVFKKNKDGLSGWFKVIGQVVLGIIVAVTMLLSDEMVVRLDYNEAVNNGYNIVETVEVEQDDVVIKYAYVKSTLTNIPFLKDKRFSYDQVLFFLGDNAERFVWVIFIPIVIFIVTAVSNAANLTDGLDGLATGVSGIIAATLLVFCYVSGNSIAAEYLGVYFLPGSGELVVFTACFLGACIGFLWHNSFPAAVFMGDTGSLALGGIIGALAVLIRKEWLIPILCGIFVIENLSVILQVGYFKYTKRKYGEGRRVLKMSPLHHHYQKTGMSEVKIVTRFWIVGILLAVMTILTLKIR